MKGKYGGPISIEDFYQALYQDRDFFKRHGITHIRATYLYFTPCNAYGQPVFVSDKAGNPIDGFISAGGYHSAADAYDSGSLEPRSLSRAPLPFTG